MPIHTLVIEDEPIIAMDLCQRLEDMGLVITGSALTHHDALEQALKTVPDLIIADISLADRSSGSDAAFDIRAKLGHIPVLFISGRTMELPNQTDTRNVAFLRKPASDRDIQRAIKKLTGREP